MKEPAIEELGLTRHVERILRNLQADVEVWLRTSDHDHDQLRAQLDDATLENAQLKAQLRAYAAGCRCKKGP